MKKKKSNLKVQCAGFRRRIRQKWDIINTVMFPSVYNHLKTRAVVFVTLEVTFNV